MASFDAANIQAGGSGGELDNFVPELWSNEIVASSELNKVLAALVTNFNHTGGKGDTIHIPRPIRGAASAMTQGSSVTLVNTAESEVSITLDKFYEYSRLVSDLAKVQAIDSYRMFYTEDAGVALSNQIDTDLHTLSATLIDPKVWSNGAGTSHSKALIGGDMDTFWDATANTNAGNGSVLTDDAVRQARLLLSLMGAPYGERYWVIPPESEKTLLGIARFTEQSFVGEAGPQNSIRNGRIGNLYGDPVYVSQNCPTIQAADASTNYRVGMYFHRSAFALVTQRAINMETARMAQFKADLLSADVIYGVGKLSTYYTTGNTALDMAIAFVVPANA